MKLVGKTFILLLAFLIAVNSTITSTTLLQLDNYYAQQVFYKNDYLYVAWARLVSTPEQPFRHYGDVILSEVNPQTSIIERNVTLAFESCEKFGQNGCQFKIDYLQVNTNFVAFFIQSTFSHIVTADTDSMQVISRANTTASGTWISSGENTLVYQVYSSNYYYSITYGTAGDTIVISKKAISVPYVHAFAYGIGNLKEDLLLNCIVPQHYTGDNINVLNTTDLSVPAAEFFGYTEYYCPQLTVSTSSAIACFDYYDPFTNEMYAACWDYSQYEYLLPPSLQTSSLGPGKMGFGVVDDLGENLFVCQTNIQEFGFYFAQHSIQLLPSLPVQVSQSGTLPYVCYETNVVVPNYRISSSVHQFAQIINATSYDSYGNLDPITAVVLVNYE